LDSSRAMASLVCCPFSPMLPLERRSMAPSVRAQPRLGRGVSREDSGPFYFQHAFVRDNVGNIADIYDKASQLGSGAFGTAHLGVCKQTGIRRAVKSIAIAKVKNPERFETEIGIARELDHPNVVRLYETFRDEHHIHLVMELCTGGELFDRIMSEAPAGFSESHASGYIQQMLSAISYLHANCFVHRDVKPENFLLQSKAADASLKLIDFGLSRRFERGEMMSTRGGTPYYVAPEIFAGRYDERVDVWSAGVVAFILLCGYPPFNGKTDREVVRRVRSGCFKFLSPDWDHVSDETKLFIVDLLTFNAACRPSATAALTDPRLVAAVGHGLRAAAEEADSVPQATGAQFMEKLKAFHSQTRLKRVCLTAAVQQLPDQEIGVLRAAFRSLDKNGDGRLSPEEIYEALHNHGLSTPMVLEEVLRSVDSNGSGCLDYTEFLAATVDQSLCQRRDIAHSAFRTFDLNGDGRITSEELQQALSSDDIDHSPSASRVQRMVDEADVNGDGCIDFEEFFALMCTGDSAGRSTLGEKTCAADCQPNETTVDERPSTADYQLLPSSSSIDTPRSRQTSEGSLPIGCNVEGGKPRTASRDSISTVASASRTWESFHGLSPEGEVSPP